VLASLAMDEILLLPLEEVLLLPFVSILTSS
jgi:hypothetical protein